MLTHTLTKLVPTLSNGRPLDLTEAPYTSDVQVVGESDYQEHLARLAEFGVQPCFGVATLVPVNQEPFERHAVRVDIAPIDMHDGGSGQTALPVRFRTGSRTTFTVGYLSYEDAMQYRTIFDDQSIMVQASIHADELGAYYGVWLEMPYWEVSEQAA